MIFPTSKPGLRTAQALRETAESKPFLDFEDAAFEQATAAPALGRPHVPQGDEVDFMQCIACPGSLRLTQRDALFAGALVEALDEDSYLRISLEDIGAALAEPDAGAELRIALRRPEPAQARGSAAR